MSSNITQVEIIDIVTQTPIDNDLFTFIGFSSLTGTPRPIEKQRVINAVSAAMAASISSTATSVANSVVTGTVTQLESEGRFVNNTKGELTIKNSTLNLGECAENEGAIYSCSGTINQIKLGEVREGKVCRCGVFFKPSATRITLGKGENDCYTNLSNFTNFSTSKNYYMDVIAYKGVYILNIFALTAL